MTADSANTLPQRGHPVHQPISASGNQAVIIFLTVCTADRRTILASHDTHTRLRHAWQKANRWLVGRYVIMPDHIHLFCAPGTMPPEALPSWISYWKRLVSFSHGGSFWQKNFWDTQLRRHESYGTKWEYVRQNPVRAGLVQRPEDWPYQGELSVLRWHD